MRTRKKLLFAIALAVAAAAVVWLAWGRHPSRVPTLSIAVLDYTNQSPDWPVPAPWGSITNPGVFPEVYWIRAQASLKNDGALSIDTARCGFVEAQTAKGRTNGIWQGGYLGFMRPRSRVALTVLLPAGTVRWRCSITAQLPSVRERAIDRMMRNDQLDFVRPVAWFLDPLPSKSGPKVELKSGWFEVGVITNSQPLFILLEPADAAPGR